MKAKRDGGRSLPAVARTLTHGGMTPGAPPVNLQAVARAARVHVSTVSLALRGHPRIPAHTRRRIQLLASRLGYHRDPVRAALVSYRRNTGPSKTLPSIAFLSNKPDTGQFEGKACYRLFLEGARERAEALGYRCDLVLVGGSNLGVDELDAHLVERKTEGIIIGALEPRYDAISLDWERYAVVKIDTRFMEPAATFVSNDQTQVVRLACERLLSLGYRRIGLATGRKDEEATNDFYCGGFYIEQAGRAPRDRIPPLFFRYHDTPQSAATRFRTWVRRHDVQVVICNWDEILDLTREAGLRVPRDVACCCLCLSGPDPRLSGVIQNHRIVGQLAAEMLALNLRQGRRGAPDHPSYTYVPGAWNPGRTAPPRMP